MADALKQAVKSFKEEQAERKVEKITVALRRIVNALADIKEREKDIAKVSGELKFKITPKFRKFLENIDRYDDLIISASGSNVSFGTPDSNEVFVANTATGSLVAATT